MSWGMQQARVAGAKAESIGLAISCSSAPSSLHASVPTSLPCRFPLCVRVSYGWMLQRQAKQWSCSRSLLLQPADGKGSPHFPTRFRSRPTKKSQPTNNRAAARKSVSSGSKRVGGLENTPWSLFPFAWRVIEPLKILVGCSPFRRRSRADLAVHLSPHSQSLHHHSLPATLEVRLANLAEMTREARAATDSAFDFCSCLTHSRAAHSSLSFPTTHSS